MQLLRKLFGPPARSGLELISIHVPKTAGTSFRNILEQVYGDGLLGIYGIDDGVDAIWEDRPAPVGPAVRAIHGHFPATPTLVAQYPDARLVGWIRDPVARMVSYYHFWRRTPPHGNPNHDFFLAHDFSLVQFAGLDFMKNEMLQYFSRVPLDRFAFVGVVEHFDADIRRLARTMGWRLADIPRTNTAAGTPAPDPAEREALESVLADEIAFYHQVKRMRGIA